MGEKKKVFRVRVNLTKMSVPYRVECDGCFAEKEGVLFYNGEIDTTKDWHTVLFVPYSTLVEYHEVEFENNGIDLPGDYKL